MGSPTLRVAVESATAAYLAFTLVWKETDNYNFRSPMNPEVSKEGAGAQRAFATTHWSLILSAAKSESGDQKAHDALEELCRIYWRPVFSFICWRGNSTGGARKTWFRVVRVYGL